VDAKILNPNLTHMIIVAGAREGMPTVSCPCSRASRAGSLPQPYRAETRRNQRSFK